jgi:hypothetical protein
MVITVAIEIQQPRARHNASIRCYDEQHVAFAIDDMDRKPQYRYGWLLAGHCKGRRKKILADRANGQSDSNPTRT